MIGFAESYLAWLASTMIPTFGGLTFVTYVGRFTRTTYLASFAFGIFLWYFVDTVRASASLGVNSGFAGGLDQVALVLLFLCGLLPFILADRHREIFSTDSAPGKYSMIIPLTVALSLGIHGLGEGAAYGGTVFNSAATSLLDVFGGPAPAVGYILHKGLEPMIIGVSFCAYAGGLVRSGRKWLEDMFLLSVIFVLPSLVGAAVGYFIQYDTTYYYALGAGTSLYAGLRVAKPLFDSTKRSVPGEQLVIAASLILGFIALYTAALFHS